MHVKKAHSKTVAVIFAGGDGTRLWPVSTPTLPKQVNPIFSGSTLFVEAYERALLAFPKERIVVVTTENLANLVRHLVNLPEKNLVIQPHNADTTAAIALAALHLEIRFPDSVAVMLFSDHKIYGLQNFFKTINRVATLARNSKHIICIGTQPTYPETQYGYIKIGKKSKYTHLYEVERFTEKPDKAAAQLFISTKKYLWNTGVYVWKTAVMLDQLKCYAPDIYHELLELRILASEKEYFSKLHDWFDRVERISFEKKVTEKLEKLYVYEADYTWQDIGNWESFYKSCEADDCGNVIISTHHQHSVDTVQTQGCLVIPYNQRIALLGVQNLVVIQTENTVFISDRKVAHKVKDLRKE